MALPTPAALIFDLGGVIVRHDNELLYDRLASLCANPAEARSQVRSLIDTTHIDKGHISIPQFHQLLVKQFNAVKDYDLFLQVWNCHFSPEPGMADLLPILAKKFPLFILSNTNAEHWQYIKENYPEVSWFKRAFLSHELGMRKPDGPIYQYVINDCNLPAEQCLFIDDRQENVEGAKRVGLDALCFKNVTSFQADLRLRDVKI